MNIFKKKSYFSVSGTEEKKKTEKNKKSQEPSIPDGMWIKCNTCKNIIYKKEVTEFTLESLNEDMLVEILKEPKNSLVKQYEKLFELDGVKLEFDESAINAIAEKSMTRKTGARGLRAIMEAVMLDLMYRIPSDETISKCVIDKALVEKNLALDGSEVPAIEKKDEEKDEELAS